MASATEIRNGSLKTALLQVLDDFLSVFVFAAIYALTHSVFVAAGTAMAVAIGQFAMLRLRGRLPNSMQWFSGGLVIVLGSASYLFDDPHFLMIKPSIGHGVVALAMLRPGWLLRYMPPIVTDNVPRSASVLAGYAWAALIFLLAAINLYVALNFSVETWGLWLLFGVTGAKLVGLAVHYLVFRSLVIRGLKQASAARMGRPAADLRQSG